ncbi:MAG: tRNA adenosine(34) deaminase TadA [Planctomycetota bacterium]
MHRALELARAAGDQGEAPVGAVVYEVASGRVVAEGGNLRETDADPTAHAEIVALRRAAEARGLWRLDGYGLAVTLEPCPMCAGALVNARIDELVYGAADPKMGCVRSLATLCDDPRFNHRMAIRTGVLAEECGAVLRDFFRARRAAKSTQA